MSATIKHTNDVDTLKQMATLLELENKTLLERNQLLAQEIAQLKGISPSTQLTLEIKALQEKVDSLATRQSDVTTMTTVKKSKSQPIPRPATVQQSNQGCQCASSTSSCTKRSVPAAPAVR
jgi:hypothetical protein